MLLSVPATRIRASHIPTISTCASQIAASTTWLLLAFLRWADTGEGPIATWGVEDRTGNYFDALGIQPYLGRFFHGSDEHGPNSAPYIVLSYGYWHRQFQDDRRVLGRIIQVNRHPFTIIGVRRLTFAARLFSSHPTSSCRWSTRSKWRAPQT